MRVAWFTRRSAADDDLVDDTAFLLDELGSRHHVELYDARRAHDFVWQHWRAPFDVCVYELSDRPAASFVWPYLLQYPGIVRLRSTSAHRTRLRALRLTGRRADSAAEAAFSGRRAIRIPVAASRLTVTADADLAHALQDEYPEARVRQAPIGVPAATSASPGSPHIPLFAAVDPTTMNSVRRAARRARDTGSQFEMLTDVSSSSALAGCDVVISLPWPPAAEPPVAALRAMAAGRAVIVHETAVTAGWPALDPQTWQPRGPVARENPVVVSLDPRDEEHSLMLAMRRLAADAALRGQLGAAAQAWWREHATVAQAARAWERLLDEAASLEPPARPAGWPAHLDADGTERAREILAEIGVTVDFLAYRFRDRLSNRRSG